MKYRGVSNMSYTIHGSRLPTWLLAVVILPVLVLLASCKSSTPPRKASSTGTALTLNGAGASFPYPLYARWIEQYKAVDAGVNINYQSIGSGGGIKQLQAGTVDFGASDAPLTDAEARQMPSPVIHLPMAGGAVAVVYNLPGIRNGVKLTPEVLTDIFLGSITKWNDAAVIALNPDLHLPDLSIAVTHRSDGSGTTFLFTGYLAKISKPWAKQVGAGKSVNWPAGIGGKGSEGVSGVLKQTPGSIGYVELAYAEQNGLTYAALRNAAGAFVLPSAAATQAAIDGAANALKSDVRTPILNAAGKGAYPISGLTYLLIYRTQRDAARGAALVSFLRWASHDGQQTASALHYAPLSAVLVAANDAALQTVILPGAAGATSKE